VEMIKSLCTRASVAPAQSHRSSSRREGPKLRAPAAALAATVLSVAPPALAISAETFTDFNTFSHDPVVLGAFSVTVVWGLPQTLGMAALAKKEQRARAIAAEEGIDVSDIADGKYGFVVKRLKDSGIKFDIGRGERR